MTTRRLSGWIFAVAFVAASAVSWVTAAFAAATAPGQPDIHDIRGPIPIPYWWLVPAFGLAALALVALGVAIYRLLRRGIRPRVQTAAEVALERIEGARAHLGSGRAAEFSAELSDAVRDYVEARFGLRAAHKTTEEFLRELVASASSPIAGHREALNDFLSACDLAKFARFALSEAQMGAMISGARRFIETAEAEEKSSERSVTEGALRVAAVATEVGR